MFSVSQILNRIQSNTHTHTRLTTPPINVGKYLHVSIKKSNGQHYITTDKYNN